MSRMALCCRPSPTTLPGQLDSKATNISSFRRKLALRRLKIVVNFLVIMLFVVVVVALQLLVWHTFTLSNQATDLTKSAPAAAQLVHFDFSALSLAERETWLHNQIIIINITIKLSNDPEQASEDGKICASRWRDLRDEQNCAHSFAHRSYQYGVIDPFSSVQKKSPILCIELVKCATRNSRIDNNKPTNSLTSHQLIQPSRLVAAVCRLLLTIITMDHQLANLLPALVVVVE